jgi:CRISPR-associated protein Csx3
MSKYIEFINSCEKAMTPYHIHFCEDVLKLDFAKTPNGETIPADGDQIVAEVESQLEQMIANGELRGGNLLKISGRIPVLACYTLAHKVADLYRAVAVFDPRLEAYVVVNSSRNEYPLGSRIDLQTEEVQLSSHCSMTEPSFFINWEQDVLTTSINPTLKVDGDQIVRDVGKRLGQMISNGELRGGKFLKINGRSTVLASFVIANQLADLYASIAVCDPKLGDIGVERYIVTISHSGDYLVGQSIGVRSQLKSAFKVVLCGPANSGKTVLKEGLKQAILQHPEAPTDFYTISGCPDGDGSFYYETAQKNSVLARQLKTEYKAKFTPEFALSKARDIERISNSLLLFDVGGKITPENQIIMSKATHAVILAKTEDEVRDWKNFCETQLDYPLSIVAILYSDYSGYTDTIENKSPILQGRVHYLERGEDVSNRLMLKTLADTLIKLVQSA